MVNHCIVQVSWIPRVLSPKLKESQGTKQKGDGNWQKNMGYLWILKQTLNLCLDIPSPGGSLILLRKGEEKVTGRLSQAKIWVLHTPGLRSQGSGPVWLNPRNMVFLTQRCCSTWKTKDEVNSWVPWGSRPVTCPPRLRVPHPSHSPGETAPSVKCQGPQSKCPACPSPHLGSQPPRATLLTPHSQGRRDPGKPSARADHHWHGKGLCLLFAWSVLESAHGRNDKIHDFFNFYNINTTSAKVGRLGSVSLFNKPVSWGHFHGHLISGPFFLMFLSCLLTIVFICFSVSMPKTFRWSLLLLSFKIPKQYSDQWKGLSLVYEVWLQYTQKITNM